MKAIIFAVLLGILIGGNLLALVPQETHEPTYCAMNHKDPNHRCDCVNQDHGEGCKNGVRDVEMKSCLAYCDKSQCHCCAS